MRIELPLVSADGNINVANLTEAFFFGYRVSRRLDGQTTVTAPIDPLNPGIPLTTWYVHDVYGGLVEFATTNDVREISVGPWAVAQLFASKNILLRDLAPEAVRSVGDGIWQIAIHSPEGGNQFYVYVNAQWDDKTVPGLRND